MSNETIRSRLMVALVIFEIALVSLCALAGYNISTAHGGTLIGATPILLIGLAEATRVPLAGWATRLRFSGKILAGIVLLCIAVGTGESLAIVFESFIQNRVMAVSQARDVVSQAQSVVDEQQRAHDEAAQLRDTARSDVSRLDAAISDAAAHAPTTPAMSGKTCGKNNSTCWGDRMAQETYSKARKSHDASIAAMRAERSAAQAKAAENDSFNKHYNKELKVSEGK